MSRWQAASDDPEGDAVDPLAEQIAAALEAKGYVVDRAVGQSHFRCDLAVRREGETAYRLAILLDNDGYYDQSDLLERDLMRPKLLRDFGWKVAFVLAKDWYDNRTAVLDRLERLIAGEEEPAENEEPTDDNYLVADRVAEDLQEDPPAQLAAESEVTIEASGAPPKASGSIPIPLVESSAAIEAVAAAKITRRFEFTSDSAKKFWEITLAGMQHTVRFGRIGAKGQSVTKTFEGAVSARRDCERLIRSKTAKGYREVSY